MKKKIILMIVLLILLVLQVSSFTQDSNTGLTALQYGSQAWGDYNNDGDYDLAVCGDSTSADYNTIIYRMNSSASGVNRFTAVNFGIIDVTECSLNWGDINKDGWVDLIVAGKYGGNDNEFVTSIYSNINGTSFNNSQNLTGIKFGYTILGDIDNDLDLDLALIGCSNGTVDQPNCQNRNASIYRNEDGSFVHNETWSANLTGVWKGALAFGDMDNDGDIDLVISGTTNQTHTGALTKVYKNNGTTFNEDVNNNLPGIFWGAVVWNDYDNDYDLDLIITGRNTTGNAITNIYNSDSALIINNTKPSAPTILNATYHTNYFNITWNNGSDTETSTSGLYYNLRVGSNETRNDIISSKYAVSSNPTQGYFGNSMQMKNKSLYITEQCIFYSVQAVDTGFQKSVFSTAGNYSSNETCDSYDNDCNGRCSDGTRCWQDSDCGSGTCLTIDDGFDQNQNGTIDDNETFDYDGDGYYPKTTLYYNLTCSGYSTYDCDDTDASEYPGAECDRTGYTGATLNNNCVCTGGDLITDSYGSSGGSSSITVSEEVEAVVEEPVEIITDSSKDGEIVAKIATDRYRYEREILVKGGRTQITEKIKNVDFLEITNANINIEIPKNIEDKASEIIKEDEFEIIQEDPEINFDIGDIRPIQTVKTQYIIKKELEVEEVKEIIAIIISEDIDKEAREKEIQRQIDETRKFVNITQEIDINYEKNQTEFTINIEYNESEAVIGDVYIYTEIPKCLIEIIKEELIESEYEFDIVSEDPLIVWHFDSLLDVDKIQYSIKAIADEDCANQAKSLAIAKKIVQMHFNPRLKNILLILLPIPFIIFIMILFGVFSKEIKHENPRVRRLISYVKHHFKQGFKEYHVRDKLRKEGYKEKEIRQAVELNSRNKLHYWVQRLEVGFGEFVLLALIILNILDFTELLPGDADYIKKIISWTILAFLLYHVSITKILFGKRRKWIDIGLIGAFFLLILKNMVGFANAAFIETTNQGALVTDLYAFIVQNNQIFEIYFFLAGIILLSGIALYLAFREDVKAPSFLNIVHFHPSRSLNPLKILKRFVITKITFLVFFIVIFNLVMEWLAIAVDALILVITLGFVIFLVLKHRKKIKPSKIMYDITETSEKFYERFIDLFHYKKTVLLGVSGMLVLHILTELGNYLIPYITGIHDAIYFGNFNEGHLPIFNIIASETKSLFALQSAGLTLFSQISIFLGFLLGIIAILYLIILPAYVWFHMFKNRKLSLKQIPKIMLNKVHVFLATTSILFMVIRPVFVFKSLNVSGLVGVDIQTKLLDLANIDLVLGICFIAGIVAVLLTINYRSLVKKLILTASFGFFAYYIYLFFKNTVIYYLATIKELVNSNMTISIYLVIFLVINILFYSVGMLSLFVELYLRRELWFEKYRIAFVDFFIRHHHMPHIHHYEAHKHELHGEEKAFLKTYIYDGLLEGHSAIHIAEHLVEHGWGVDAVRKAVAGNKKLSTKLNDLVYYHKHIRKIKGLEKILKKNKRLSRKEQEELVLKNGYSKKDFELALRDK